MSTIATTLAALFLQSGASNVEMPQTVIAPVTAVVVVNPQERFRFNPLPIPASTTENAERPLRWETSNQRFQISLARVSLIFRF